MKNLFLTSIFLCFCNFASAQALNLAINFPVDRAVFQKNASNEAEVWFSGQFDPNTNYQLEYSVSKLNLQTGNVQQANFIPWTEIIPNSQKMYRHSRSLLKGWYLYEVRTLSGTTTVQTKSVKVGVGEVFILAGQSNSQGYESQEFDPGIINYFQNYQAKYGQYYDCVNVLNANFDCNESKLYHKLANLSKLDANTRIAPKGVGSWCYAVLGAEIALSQQEPVAFFNAGAEGTSAYHWFKTAENNNFAADNFYSSGTYCGTSGIPYLPFRNALQVYASLFGVKAVLWHQGKTDAQFVTANVTKYGNLVAEYKTRLEYVIDKSRTEFGNTLLSWFVSEVSYSNGGNINTGLTTIQNQVSSNSNNQIGVLTDEVGLTYFIDGQTRQSRNIGANVHFHDWGLYEFGIRWKNKNILNGNAIPAKPLFELAITPNNINSTYTMTVLGLPSGNYTYYWVDNLNDISTAPTTTVNSFSVPFSSQKTYQCYARENGKAFYISQSFTTQSIILGIDPLKIYPSNVNAPAYTTGDQYYVDISSSGINWTATSDSWIKNLTPSSGNGFLTMIFEIESNSGLERTGQIIITGDGYTRYVNITQAALGILEVSPHQIYVLTNRDMRNSVTVNSTIGNWVATSSDNSWIVATPDAGIIGETPVRIFTYPEQNFGERAGYVDFSNVYRSDVVNIYQFFYNCIEFGNYNEKISSMVEVYDINSYINSSAKMGATVL